MSLRLPLSRPRLSGRHRRPGGLQCSWSCLCRGEELSGFVGGGGPPSPPHVSTTASQSVHATPSLSPWCVGGSGLFPRVSRCLSWAIVSKFMASENWNRIRLLIGREMIKLANMKYWGSFLNSRDVRIVVPSSRSDCSHLWLTGPLLGGRGC